MDICYGSTSVIFQIVLVPSVKLDVSWTCSLKCCVCPIKIFFIFRRCLFMLFYIWLYIFVQYFVFSLNILTRMLSGSLMWTCLLS